ncbi:hypothetical protein OfM1_09220 [Lactovum odontotermitis]
MKLRIIIVAVATLFLSFVLAGSMKEVGQSISYPANAIMNVTAYTGENKPETIEKINNLAKQSKITIYKAFVPDSGVTETAKFGLEETNLEDLQNHSIIGTYFLSSQDKQFVQSMMADGSLKVDFQTINVSIMPLVLLTQGGRAPSIWALFFIFFISVFAVEMSFIKRGMIYRSLGRFKHYVLVNLFQYLGMILALDFIIVLFFSLTQGSVSGVFFKEFVLTFALSALILLLLTFLANLLFTLVVKTSHISNILKHQYVNRLGSVIYLIGILLSILIFSQSVNMSLKTAGQLSSYKQQLSSWQEVKGYVIPNVETGVGAHADVNGVIDRDYMLAQTQRELAFNQSIDDEDFIYSSPSAFNAEKENSYKQALQGNKGIVNNVQTDSQFTANTLYVSRGFVLLNQKFYPENSYGETNADKLITLYVPKSLEGKVESIENNIIAEEFAFVSMDSSQFYVNIIPDNQKTFLLNYEAIQGGLAGGALPQTQVMKNRIFVQINYHLLPSFATEPLRVVGGYTDPYGRAMIRQSVLIDKLKAQGLQEQVLSTDNVSADAALLGKNVNSQLQGALMVMAATIICSVFVLWEYLKNQYQRASKSLVITYLFSGDSRRQELLLLLPLVIGVILVAILNSLITGSLTIFGFILILYLLEILVVVLINQRQLKQRRLQVMKDSLE